MNRASRAVRKLWKDKATVFIMSDYKVGSVTKKHETVLLEEITCKLSFGSLSPTNQTRSTDNKGQVVKLFLDKDLAIPAGSKIVVTRRDGKTFEYKNSSEPAVYTDLTSHQEIMLDLFDGWS